MVTRYGYRVELGHVFGRVANDVADDAHARRRRIDIGVAHHELFEDVVLYGAAQLRLRHALLFGGHDVAGQHRQDRAVHRHRDANFVQRNLVEQDLHVLHRVDGNTGLANVAGNARMVRVIAPVGGQIESDGHALPASGQRLAVKRIAFLGGRKTGVLADGPGPHRVHGGLRAAHIGRKTRQRVGIGQMGRVRCRIQRLDDDAVGRGPVQRIHIPAGRGLGSCTQPGGMVALLKSGPGCGLRGLGCGRLGAHGAGFQIKILSVFAFYHS